MFLLLGVLLCLVPSAQVSALTLTGSLAPDASTIVGNQCPGYPDYRYLTTANNASVITSGYSPGFETAWNAVLPNEWDPAGWTLQFSDTPIPANLSISTYRAYDDSLSTGLGGAEIAVDWTPTADQQSLEWIQAIHTNRPKRSGAEWYLDVMRLRPELPPVYPFSYNDYHFYDKPGRYYESGEHIYWDAYLYLASVDRDAMCVTVYEGINWGFTIDCVAVPEPGNICVIIAGLAGIIIRAKIRQR